MIYDLVVDAIVITITILGTAISIGINVVLICIAIQGWHVYKSLN